MTHLTLETEVEFDDTPFPLIVAKRFNFPLAYHESGDEVYYAVQDWLRGLMGKQDVRKNLGKIRTSHIWEEICKRLHRMPYITTNGKIYQLEFTTGQSLILILNHLRSSSSPLVSEIKVLWSHWFTAKMENQNKGLPSFSSMPLENIVREGDEYLSPIDMVGIAVKGIPKSDIKVESIHTMLNYTLRLPHLLDELRERVIDPILPKYYDIITEEIYTGLWGRSPKRLKLELGVASVANLIEYMHPLARLFYEIVRKTTLCVLSQEEKLWWTDIHFAVRRYARFFGKQVKQTSELLEMDIATGRPLLPS